MNAKIAHEWFQVLDLPSETPATGDVGEHNTFGGIAVNLGNIPHLAAEVGIALADGKPGNLARVFETDLPKEQANPVSVACWNLLRTAILLQSERLDKPAEEVSQESRGSLDPLAKYIWQDPESKGFRPILEWFVEQVSNQNVAALWILTTVVGVHRDLVRDLIDNPSAKERRGDYSGLPTKKPLAELRAISAAFSLLSTMVGAARDALIVAACHEAAEYEGQTEGEVTVLRETTSAEIDTVISAPTAPFQLKRKKDESGQKIEPTLKFRHGQPEYEFMANIKDRSHSDQEMK